MRKQFISLTLLFSVLVFTKMTFAQGMMGGLSAATPDEITQTAKDEVAGKAVWDKLQNKEVVCAKLTNDDFDVLGDFFMGNAVGSNHASMNLMMKNRMGEEGEKQMHIAMGKRLSGCATNATLPNGSSYFMPMMGGLGGMMGGLSQNALPTQVQARGFSMMDGYGYSSIGQNRWSIFGAITWILGILFLILGVIYFWKGIQRKK
ncbi:MAG: hypothetical protein WCO78_01940 [Candidatus Roizmanbacteria bacterium]